MRRKKIGLLSALGVVLCLGLAARLGGLMPANVRDFGFGNTPMARLQLVLAAIPWVLFGFYWGNAAKQAAPARSAESKSSRGLHVVLANVALVLELIQIPGSGRFLPLHWLIVVAGFLVSAIGLFAAIWARRHLGRNWSGEISIKVEHQLIRSGPYKLVRHPIYTGILTMYAGTAVVTGTWLALAGLGVAGFAYWRKIRLEEINLRAAFGAEYDVYRHQTWALMPGLF